MPCYWSRWKSARAVINRPGRIQEWVPEPTTGLKYLALSATGEPTALPTWLEFPDCSIRPILG